MTRPCTPLITTPASEKRHATAGDPLSKPLAGPGWYESTWELISGLEVTEVLHAEPDGRRRAASVERLSARA